MPSLKRHLPKLMRRVVIHFVDEQGLLRDQEGNRFVFRFNVRNIAAERFIQLHSSELITRIVEDQKLAVRNALEDGLRVGANPRATALEVVGRINRRTKQREGGILGLSTPQEKAVAKARQELNEGDYGAYLRRSKRDRRFDGVIRKAIAEEKPLTREQVNKLLGRYSDRLLKLRGDTISRTETLTALNAGQYQSIKQLIETGKVDSNQVTLTWDASRDTRTRIDHLTADGQMVKFGQEFIVGGRRMKYPGDPNGGPVQVINCRCTLRVRVNHLSNVA